MDEISQYAIKLLSIRDRTEADLVRRLEARFVKVPEGLIEELRSKGYLDDRRFARNYLERKPGLAPERAHADLASRGIAEEIAAEAIGNRDSSDRPSLAKVVKATMDDWRLTVPVARRDAGRLFRKLARLGYSPDDITEELERLNG